MATLEGDIEGGEAVLVLGLVVVIGYFIYQLSQSFCETVNTLFGLTGGSCSGPSNPNTQGGGSYANAANQVATNPLGSLGSILGLGQGTTAPTTGQTVAGTLVTSGGQNYRCNGTNCFPISTDASGNELVSGPSVPQSQLNSATTQW